MTLPKRYDIFTNRSVRLSEELAEARADGRELKGLMRKTFEKETGLKRPKIGRCRKARR